MASKSIAMVCLLAAVIITFAPLSATSQTMDVKVQILNSPPKAYGVYATSLVKSDGTDVVWCIGWADDLNGFQDINWETAHLLTPSGDVYKPKTEASLIRVEQDSVTAGTVLAGFVIDPEAPTGEWSCLMEVKDRAGDQAQDKSTFKVYPPSCADKANCGGECLPCECFNGITDGGETGPDCGGPCQSCAPKDLLLLTAPSQVYNGELMSLKVEARHDDGLTGVASLVRVIRPSGKITVYKTDKAGLLTLVSDESGRWDMRADLYGFEEAKANVEVKTPLTTYIFMALGALVLIEAAILVRKRMGGKKEAAPQGRNPPSSP
jgi:hypothetical protein